MAEPIGSMVCQPVLFYDWVIPDFLNWADTAPSQLHPSLGPDFIIRNKRFFFVCYVNATHGTVCIWLGKGSEDPIFLSHFSLSLVREDGSEKEICSKTNVTFTDSFLDEFKEDGTFNKGSLAGFLSTNGELRIRSRIKVRYQEKPKELKTDVPVQENFQNNVASLMDDLSLQFSEQTLSFTDSSLVCGNKELMVHRFMLATRSPVFKAMFSHEESSENHGRKVSTLFLLAYFQQNRTKSMSQFIFQNS
jgi:hypothetical protein